MTKISIGKTATVREELVEMNDGVKLYTRLVTPNFGEKFPIIFIRSPYSKPLSESPLNLSEYDNDAFIKAGYAIVFQHCRGTGESEGFCVPYENEREDGLCTLEYIRSLNFYNGEIYLKGGSYLSSVHLLYLSDKPRDIKGALLEIQTDRMYFRNYKNGCNYNFCNAEWWFSMSKRKYPDTDLSQINKRPYIDIARRAIGEDYPEFTANLFNCEYNDYWKNDPRTDVINAIDFPVLFVEGWYDFYIDGMFSMWERMLPQVKEKSAFIVGPYGHDVKTDKSYDYKNLSSAELPEDYAPEWFNSIRERREYKYAKQGYVNYYSIGADKWYAEEYPVNNSSEDVCFALSDMKSEQQTDIIEYTYDPDKKINLFSRRGLWKSDDAHIEDGVVSLYSETFGEDVSFFGTVDVTMTVSSDAQDTAFYMCLNFSENGSFYPLTEVISSLSYFYPEYSPGDMVTLKLQTAPIGFTVHRGEKIRVDFSSTGGKYVPHANIREHWALVDKTITAENKIFLKDSSVKLHKSE